MINLAASLNICSNQILFLVDKPEESTKLTCAILGGRWWNIFFVSIIIGLVVKIMKLQKGTLCFDLFH